MTEEKEIDNKEEVKEIKKSKNRFLKFLAPIVFVILVISLIIIKVVYSSFPLGWIIGLGVLFFIICILIFFGFEIMNWWGSKGKQELVSGNPQPITIAEAYDKINRIMTSRKYGTYIGEILDEGVQEHGRLQKQKIYCILFKNWHTGSKYFAAINLHYPDTNFRILINVDWVKIPVNEMSIKRLTTDPEEEPNKEIIRRRNPLLGTEEEIITKSHHKDIKKEPEKEELK